MRYVYSEQMVTQQWITYAFTCGFDEYHAKSSIMVGSWGCSFYDGRRKTVLKLHIKACLCRLCYTELLMVLQKILHLIKRAADDGLSTLNCSFTRIWRVMKIPEPSQYYFRKDSSV